MSMLADEMNEWIPVKPYIALELRMVPNAEGVYNITNIKKCDTLGEVIKDYNYSDFETPYCGVDEAIEEAMSICNVSKDDIHVTWGNY